MANALKGKTAVSITWIASNDTAAEAMRVFFEGHFEFMVNKSYREGPLKLVTYSIAESPEWAENKSWEQGKIPATTGRTIFNLYEIYETPDGLHHHWIESAGYLDTFYELMETHKIEVHLFNQMKIIQSLWE